MKSHRYTSSGAVAVCFFVILAIFSACQGQKGETRWLKGNIHAHSFWSDGDHVPELVVKAYKDLGYDFLALTDHNVIHKTPTTGPLHRLLWYQDIIDG